MVSAGWYRPGGRFEHWIVTPLLVLGAVFLAFPAAGAPAPHHYLAPVVQAVTSDGGDP